MRESYRIVVADDEPLLIEEIEAYLQDAGHEVVGKASTGVELMEQCKALQPDVVVTDIMMPEMDGLEAISLICEKRAVPVILISAYHDDAYIRRAKEHSIMSYLIKPIDEGGLRTSLSLAMRRFKEFEVLRKENVDLKQALEERKIIEKAKGILMKRTSLDENASFQRLQKLARDKGISMITVAQSILDAEEAFDV